MSCTAESLASFIAHANGSDGLYRHRLGLLFTGGVRHVAETAGAFWLIDAVASHQTRAVRTACRGFQAWTLRRNRTGSGAVLTCTDGGIDGAEPRTVVTQRIAFTDFPLPEIRLYVENGVLMLTGER